MSLARQLFLRGSTSPWLAHQLSNRRFVQRAVSRFMPGESLEAAVDAGVSLQNAGMRSILTLLGENVADRSAAEQVATHYQGVVEAIGGAGLAADLSVKPTHLGLDLGTEVAEEALRAVVVRAGAAGRLVVVDMESSAYVDATLALFRRVHATQRNVGLCLQTYLRRTAADLEALLPLNPAIRLVKGAYAEPPDRAFPRKADVDANFAALGQTLMTHAARTGAPAPVLGTHDIRLVRRLQQVAVDAGLDPQACEVHMLYGIRTAEQEQLLRDGYAVRVLISYGAAWFRWYMRRLAERPANVWFVMRSVVA